MTGTSSIIAGVLFHPMSSSMRMNIVPRCIHPSVYYHLSNYIVPVYIRLHSRVPWERLYHATIYIHPHSLVPWEWLYHATIYPSLLSSSMGMNVSWHNIFTPGYVWWGGDYILTYFHSWQYLMRGWIYPDIIFSILIIFGNGGDYIVTL